MLSYNFIQERKNALIIGILGLIIAFISGSVFVKVDHSMDGDGVGAAFGAALIGIVIVSNGLKDFNCRRMKNIESAKLT